VTEVSAPASRYCSTVIQPPAPAGSTWPGWLLPPRVVELHHLHAVLDLRVPADQARAGSPWAGNKPRVFRCPCDARLGHKGDLP
jgi:hypothetical protein